MLMGHGFVMMIMISYDICAIIIIITNLRPINTIINFYIPSPQQTHPAPYMHRHFYTG